MTKVLVLDDGTVAGEVIVEIMEHHMTHAERVPVAMAFAFADERRLCEVMKLLIVGRELTIDEAVEALKRIPVELVRMEAGAN